MEDENLVELFNERFPVGSIVGWRAVAHDNCPHRDYTVQFAAVVHYGQPVAWFAEKSGMISIKPEFVKYTNETIRNKNAE